MWLSIDYVRGSYIEHIIHTTNPERGRSREGNPSLADPSTVLTLNCSSIRYTTFTAMTRGHTDGHWDTSGTFSGFVLSHRVLTLLVLTKIL